MIKLCRIQIETVEVFNPIGETEGFINEIEFLILLADIREKKETGWKLKYEDELIEIPVEGKIPRRECIFHQWDDAIDRLLGI